MPYVEHPFIKPNSIEARLYQQTILNTAIHGNTLVVLPTGLGKTSLSIMAAAHRLMKFPDNRILMMAPTRPLVTQHFQTFKRAMMLPQVEFQVLTGHTPSTNREKIWKRAKLIFATPQVVEHDIFTNKLLLDDFSLLIFDECVSEDACITMADGSNVAIRNLMKGIFPDDNVRFVNPKIDAHIKCYNHALEQESCGKITGVWRTPMIDKKIVELIIGGGSRLVLSGDHPVPVLNANKWWLRRADDIRKYDKVLIHLEREHFNDLCPNTTIVPKKQIHKICINNHLNEELVVNALEKKGLVPLKLDHPAMPIIGRIMGHIFGDGWLSKNFLTGFSGKKEDLWKIAEDLSKIGFLITGNVHERETISNVTTVAGKTLRVKGTSAQLTVGQHPLWVLLCALGAPVGDKTVKKFLAPKWLMQSPRQIIQNFLSAFCGSECDKITSQSDRSTFYAPRLTVYKSFELHAIGLKLAHQYKKLFEKLGVKISKISCRAGNKRKDGTITSRIDLTISNDNNNLINFTKNVGYEYCEIRNARAFAVLAFLKHKENRLLEMRKIHDKTKMLQKNGATCYKIAKEFGFFRRKKYGERYYITPDDQKIKRILSEKYGSRVENTFIGFKKWMKQDYVSSRNALFRVSEINDKMEVSDKWLYDIEVTCEGKEQPHTFFANNVLVHNCHRAVGNYPYGFIAEQYVRSAKVPLILALTASPGAEATKVEEVKRNLFIEHVEIRSERDADVKPYVQQIDIEWRRLELPPAFVQVKRLLDEQLRERLFELKKLGFITSVQYVTKRDLLRVQQEILEAMHELEPNPPENFYRGLMAQASAFRLCHAVEVLETQGLDFLAHYLSQLTKKAKMPGSTKAIKLLAKDSRIEQIISIAERLRGRIGHPKMSEALQIVKKQFSESPNSRVIIFAHYRESADQIVKELNKLDNVLAVKFIGQASREDERGLSQKEQGQILDKFRSGEINVLVSTSVGEEGLDIPSVDLVIFYEAVPSEIRFIQRRGRTGRVKPGRVIALLAKGTRDEAFYWSAVKKERRMHEMLRGQREDEKGMVGQKALEEFTAEKVKVIADHREIPSGVVRELTKLGVEVEARQLDVGDFILSDRVGVERKSVKDFLQSIVDKRLMEQAQRLGETFERPMLILEGEGLYSLRAIHPNAIRGALSALAIDFGIPILPTRDEKETAAILAIVAKREQLEQTREVAIRGSARKLTLPEQQRFIVEGLPGVSAVLAKRLLEHFGTVERVMGASEKELQEVHGIGTEKAKEIRRVLKSIYESTS